MRACGVGLGRVVLGGFFVYRDVIEVRKEFWARCGEGYFR